WRVEMPGFDLGNLAPGGERRRRDVVPPCAVVGGDVNKAVVGACPYCLSIERRRADGIDNTEAMRHRLIDIFRGDRIEGCGQGRIDAREVRADLFPCPYTIAAAEDKLIGVVEGLVGRRKNLR